MATKQIKHPKETRTPKENKDLKTAVNGANKLVAHFGLEHITKIVDKRDTPRVVVFGLLGYIFYKALPLATETKTTFFGQPYWFVIVIFFAVILLSAYLISKD